MIYLSGSITDNPDYKSDFLKAYELCRKKFGDSVEIFNPCSVTNKNTWLEYMIADLEHLKQCDSVVFLQGWKKSSGCMVEKICAEKMNLKIYYIKGCNIYADVRK